MNEPAELVNSDQFRLHAMFEIIAGCGLVFAVLPYRDLVLFTLVFAILTVWSLRVTNWPIRVSLIVWLGGCCVLSFGLACVEQAFTPMFFWDARREHPEYLVFVGTMMAALGAIAGVTGLSLLLLVIGAARRGQ